MLDVGICPQFDILWEDVTVYEHLKIFGLIKGLNGIDLEESIHYFIEAMKLKKYKNIRSKNLSGGNKRKLNIGMAMIGGSDI